jgi:uncharacterized protein YneR
MLLPCDDSITNVVSEKNIFLNLSQSGIMIGMSEWMLFNANTAIFQLSWGDEVCFNVLDQQVWCYWNNSQQIDMSPHSDTLSWLVNQSVLDQQVWCYWNNSQQIDMSPHSDTLSWLVNQSVLDQQVWCYCNNSQQIDMSPHSDTLSWLVNQSLLFLLNAACLVEISNKLQFYSLWFDPIRARNHNLSPLRWAR